MFEGYGVYSEGLMFALVDRRRPVPWRAPGPGQAGLNDAACGLQARHCRAD